MSEEDMNQELKADELKDVSGGHRAEEFGDSDDANGFKQQQYALRNEKKKGKIIPDINKINPDAIRG
tara:strand:- start:445 stop:645 length:201 start_codon:yes stop_codon:yes gene_type:complete